MRDLGNTLRKLREAQGLTQAQAGKLVGKFTDKPISFRTIQSWELSSRTPNAHAFLALCLAYGKPDIYQEFCDEYGAELDDAGRAKMRDYYNDLLATGLYSIKPQPIVSMRIMKLYDVPVSAGTGNYLDGATYEEIEVDATVPASAEYALRITGDSMEPRFIDGQMVYVKPQDRVENGEVGIFFLNGDAYIKRFETSGSQPLLVSLNKKYPPIIIGEFDRLDVLGKVVG